MALVSHVENTTSKPKSQERRKWEPEEDAQLIRLIRKWGTKNWRTLANHMKGRLPKQCRERWINHLDPSITKGKLTEEEWQVVLDCHRDLGNRWSEIAKFLPGRTPNQIKNHWHAKVRKGNKRTRSEFTASSSSSSDEDSYLSNKKRRLVIYESPPSSPLCNPFNPAQQPQLVGSWEGFEALVEMAELLYSQEISTGSSFRPIKNPTRLPSLSSMYPLASVSGTTLESQGFPQW